MWDWKWFWCVRNKSCKTDLRRYAYTSTFENQNFCFTSLFSDQDALPYYMCYLKTCKTWASVCVHYRVDVGRAGHFHQLVHWKGSISVLLVNWSPCLNKTSWTAAQVRHKYQETAQLNFEIFSLLEASIYCCELEHNCIWLTSIYSSNTHTEVNLSVFVYRLFCEDFHESFLWNLHETACR